MQGVSRFRSRPSVVIIHTGFGVVLLSVAHCFTRSSTGTTEVWPTHAPDPRRTGIKVPELRPENQPHWALVARCRFGCGLTLDFGLPAFTTHSNLPPLQPGLHFLGAREPTRLGKSKEGAPYRGVEYTLY